MWQKTKRNKQESNPDAPSNIEHNNSDITTTLIRIVHKWYLVVYINLKRNP